MPPTDTAARPDGGAWLAGKVALVTGAGSGIGAAAARRFAEEGAAVCLVDLHADPAGKVAAEIRERGGQALALAADISKEADNTAMIAGAVEKFGRLDIAYLNAGILGPMAGFEALTLGDFDRILRTNLYGCFHGLKALSATLADGGAIVVTASVAGILGLKENPAYSASKHGILGLVKSTAPAFAKRHIRINAICPGGVATPMAGVMEAPAILPPGALTQPDFGGMALPQQVAELALFLASSRASAITGACYVIDAGLTTNLPTG